MAQSRIIVGIDPGLAHTGWGVVEQVGSRLHCVSYGCITTTTAASLSQRLNKIYNQMAAVMLRYNPACVGVESVWFGTNAQSAFATGQARGAALAACGAGEAKLFEFTPNQIKLAVVGAGKAEKAQVQYMVQQVLGLPEPPRPDHAADALAAALCCATYAYSRLLEGA